MKNEVPRPNLYKGKPRPKNIQKHQLESLATIKQELNQLKAFIQNGSKKDIIKYNALKEKYLRLRNEFIMQNTKIIFQRLNGISIEARNDYEANLLENLIVSLDKYIEYYFSGNPNSKNPKPTKDIRFTTYVLKKLDWESSNFFINEAYLLSSKPREKDSLIAIYSAETELMKQGKYTIEDIAKKTKLKQEYVKELRGFPKELLNIDTLYKEEKAQLKYDYESIAQEQTRKMKVEKVTNYLLGILNDKERYVVESHFGINGYPKALSEIAKEKGVTRQAISFTKIKSLKKMKEHAEGFSK